MTLTEARQAKGWGKTRLAKEAGISRVSVERYEAGTQSPNWSTVLLLSEALGMPPGELEFSPRTVRFGR